MTQSNRCHHCGGKFTGFNNWKNDIGDLSLCMKCYEEQRPFSTNTKYADLQAIDESEALLMSQLDSLGYTQVQKDQVTHYFKVLRHKMIGASQTDDSKRNYESFMRDAKRGFYTERSNAHLCSSGYNFEGYRITQYHGVVAGEIVLGTGFFSSFISGISDTLGVESDRYRDKLRESRTIAMERLVLESLFLGGNAIIGLDIDYTLFVGDMMGVIANGTSVTIEKI